jgi:hypothetical protein
VRIFVSALAFAVSTLFVGTTRAGQPETRHLRAQAPTLDIAAAAAGDELAAVREMLRGPGGRARRWAQAPQLVVVTSVLRFAGGVRQDYVATGEVISDSDAVEIARDLEHGLHVLTAGRFERFDSMTFERPDAGDRTSVMREGAIVVARFAGIAETLGAVGYGGRLARADGSIASGTVMLDSEYDRANGLRRVLRIHELGHALGFNHVTSRPSVMNPTLGSEPTDFDRRAAHMAFGETPHPQTPLRAAASAATIASPYSASLPGPMPGTRPN